MELSATDFRVAKSGPRSFGRRTTARPSGTPSASAGSSAPSTSAQCRSISSVKTSRLFSYSRTIDKASNWPAPAIAATAAKITVATASRGIGPLRSRWKASTIVSAVQNSTIQKAVPSETRTAAGAPVVSNIAAWPAARRTSNRSAVPSVATMRLSTFVGGIHDAKIITAPMAAMPVVDASLAAVQRATGRPETRRFGA